MHDKAPSLAIRSADRIMVGQTVRAPLAAEIAPYNISSLYTHLLIHFGHHVN